MNLQQEYSNADLLAFTEKLIIKTNEVQFKITHNKNLKVSMLHTQDACFKMTQNGYDNLAKEYPFFEYNTPSIKKSVLQYSTKSDAENQFGFIVKRKYVYHHHSSSAKYFYGSIVLYL